MGNEERLMYINMAFNKIDESQDGFIDAKEALSYFHREKEDDELESSKNEAKKFIEEFDTKEIDGRVSWQEFHEFYWNVSITCNKDEEFKEKIVKAWSFTKEEIDSYASIWIPQDVFPQKFPFYSSGASAVCGIHILPELLGRGVVCVNEDNEQQNDNQVTPTKPDGAKPSFGSPRAVADRELAMQALQEENASLKAQLS